MYMSEVYVCQRKGHKHYKIRKLWRLLLSSQYLWDTLYLRVVRKPWKTFINWFFGRDKITTVKISKKFIEESVRNVILFINWWDIFSQQLFPELVQPQDIFLRFLLKIFNGGWVVLDILCSVQWFIDWLRKK